MVLWQGLTEGGTAVPVQVTEAGKVVAEGKEGQRGPEGPQGPQGPPGPYGPGDDVDLGSITGTSTIKSENPSGTFSALNPGYLVVQQPGTSSLDLAISCRNSVGNEFFEVTGDGNVTVAGSGTFKTTVEIEDGNLYVYSQTTNAARWPFIVYTDVGGTKKEKFSIDSTGTAKIGGTLPGAPNIELKASEGSITAAGNKAGFTVDGELYFTSRGTRYKLEVAGGLCNAIPYTREMELRERAEALRKPRTTDSVPED